MRTCIIYGLRPDKSITLTLQSFSDVKKEKISAPVLENSENRCLLKESALKSAGTGGRIAQSVEQGTENPRVPSSILGPATILFVRKLKIHLGFSHFSSLPSDFQLTYFKALSASKCNQTVTKNKVLRRSLTQVIAPLRSKFPATDRFSV